MGKLSNGRDPSRVGVKALCLSGLVELALRLRPRQVGGMISASSSQLLGQGRASWEAALTALAPEMAGGQSLIF